eukprot:53026-Eustigmatos_ZCMA.PRE.1
MPRHWRFSCKQKKVAPLRGRKPSRFSLFTAAASPWGLPDMRLALPPAVYPADQTLLAASPYDLYKTTANKTYLTVHV